jgi:hypothetical protein
MKRPWVSLWVVALIAGLSIAGCATPSKTQNAGKTLNQAKAAGAVYKAPFEYKAAEAYLKKADFQVEKGDTKAADSFAQEAQTYADKALEMSGGGAK